MLNKFLIFLMFVSFNAACVEFPQKPDLPTTKNVSISWTAPTTREDGTVLSSSEIANYQIGYGLSTSDDPATLVDAGLVNTFTVNNLSAGEYDFGVRVFDTDGNPSDFVVVQGEVEIEVSPGTPTVSINE